MIGIGHRQEKLTKIKLLAEKSKEYNEKYDQLIAQGLDPQQVASILQKEEFDRRHQTLFTEEPYKVYLDSPRSLQGSIKSEEQFTWAITTPTKPSLRPNPSTPPWTP